MNFVDVAIPTPLRTTFTYINKTSQTLLGKRVLVEFGRRKVVGVVIDEKADNNSKYKLKEASLSLYLLLLSAFSSITTPTTFLLPNSTRTLFPNKVWDVLLI